VGTRLRDFWEAARSSFWFLPAVLTVAAVGLSFATVAIDRATAPGSHVFGWTYRGGPDGARGVLGTIAGSMIAVAGVVFSTTMVALSLASSQLGPRLLRNFIRDRGNQFVLGTFVATFVYCLLVLRTVNGTEGDVFVPEVGVTAGVALALASVGVFIYFLHHAAVSIQASTVVARVGDELTAAIDDLYPGGVGDGAEPGEVPAAGVPQASVTVETEEAGYVLRVDADALVRTAAERDLVVHLAHPLGRFVRPGDALMRVASPAGGPDVETRAALRAAVVVGPTRTGHRDIEFALRQLTEVAVRALSPGVNDPFTAVECVNRLGEAFVRLAGRAFPSPYRLGPDGRLRVVAPVHAFPDLLAGAVEPIRHHARGSPQVLAALIEASVAVSANASRLADRDAVARLIAQVVRAAEALPEPDDQARLKALAQAADRAIRDADSTHRSQT